MLGTEPRDSYLLHKGSTTEPYAQITIDFISVKVGEGGSFHSYRHSSSKLFNESLLKTKYHKMINLVTLFKMHAILVSVQNAGISFRL